MGFLPHSPLNFGMKSTDPRDNGLARLVLSCVTLDKSLNLSGHRFPHLHHRGHSGSHLIEIPQGFNKQACEQHSEPWRHMLRVTDVLVTESRRVKQPKPKEARGLGGLINGSRRSSFSTSSLPAALAMKWPTAWRQQK